MSTFDPYRVWLGIPPEEQPPNHYRLLGIGLFESEPEVIANAADRQMRHVRSFQSGRHSKLSQRLLNELSKARLCLLDPVRKTAYDEQLLRDLASKAAPAEPPPEPPGPPAAFGERGFGEPSFGEPALAEIVESARRSAASVQAVRRRRQRKRALWTAALVTVVSIAALAVGLVVLLGQIIHL